MKKSNFLFSIISFAVLLMMSSCGTEHKHDGDHHDHHKHEKHWNEEDHKLVKAAISDYVEGLYQVDTTRIIKSVDSTLRKLGYWYNPKEKVYRDNLPMTHEQLVRLAARWNTDGKRANENSPKEIVIFDINSKTASAKLTAEWGIDYFHLGKVNGEWKIFNVIWQSMPKDTED